MFLPGRSSATTTKFVVRVCAPRSPALARARPPAFRAVSALRRTLPLPRAQQLTLPLPRSLPPPNQLLLQFNSAETEDELLVCKCGARNCKGFLNA